MSHKMFLWTLSHQRTISSLGTFLNSLLILCIFKTRQVLAKMDRGKKKKPSGGGWGLGGGEWEKAHSRNMTLVKKTVLE